MLNKLKILPAGIFDIPPAALIIHATGKTFQHPPSTKIEVSKLSVLQQQLTRTMGKLFVTVFA
jgi:hypothetical protein